MQQLRNANGNQLRNVGETGLRNEKFKVCVNPLEFAVSLFVLIFSKLCASNQRCFVGVPAAANISQREAYAACSTRAA